MSVVKLSAQAALGAMLIAIVPASTAIARAQNLVSTPAEMPIEQLKGVYLGCEREAAAGALGTDDIMQCSIAYEELKRRAFDGDFQRITQWAKAQR